MLSTETRNALTRATSKSCLRTASGILQALAYPEVSLRRDERAQAMLRAETLIACAELYSQSVEVEEMGDVLRAELIERMADQLWDSCHV